MCAVNPFSSTAPHGMLSEPPDADRTLLAGSGEWHVAALCGPSGSGKSVNMRNLGEEAIAHFCAVEQRIFMVEVGQLSTSLLHGEIGNMFVHVSERTGG